MNRPRDPLTYRVLIDRRLTPPLARLLKPVLPRLLSRSVLQRMGTYLLVDTEPRRADAIVVLGGGRRQRLEHGVFLARQGLAPLLTLTSTMAARGLRGSPARNSFEEALRLGIPISKLIWLPWPRNTFEEAYALRELAEELGWSRILVVTESYHSRRAWLTFERVLRGTRLDVQFSCPPHSRSRLERWWERRRDLEVVLGEYLSLAYYVLRRRL